MVNKSMSDTQFFFGWCAKNKISVRINQEVFFVTQSALMKPEFITPGKIYIDLVNSNDITEDYINNCKSFARSFGTIMVIPRHILPELENLTKTDIQEMYSIKL